MKCGEKGIKFEQEKWLETAPWTEINNLFEKLNFNYRFLDNYNFNFAGLVENPTLYAFENNELKLDEPRNINDLSDGEKAILRLVIATYDRKNDEVTKVLLLDEYDATLNPSLIKKFYIVIKDYYLKKGIIVLLTTHSSATISLAPDGAKYYEIFRQFSDSPKIISVDRTQYNELKIANEEFYEKLEDQKNRITELELEKKSLSADKILFVEDKYIGIYKLSWLKLNNINPKVDSIDKEFESCAQFEIYSKGNKDNLKGFLSNPFMEEWNGKSIVGLFDFDDAYNCFKDLIKNKDEQTKWENKLGNIKDGLYINRKKYKNVFALMLPVPDYRLNIANENQSINRLEVELLFKDEDIDEIYKPNSCSKELVIGNVEIPKINNKEDFWKKAINLPREKFVGFIPLFNVINKLLCIDQNFCIQENDCIEKE